MRTAWCRAVASIWGARRLSSRSVTTGSERFAAEPIPVRPRCVCILEWRHGGHRLFYVAAIVRAANEADLPIELVTSSGVLDTEEYRTHLAHLAEDGLLCVRTSSDVDQARGLRRELRSIRHERRPAVVPESDRFLHVLLLAKMLRQLPLPTTAIVMRPPQSVDGSLGARARSVIKSTLLLALSRWRTLDLQLLEDPLAEGDDRVWRQPILSSVHLRLDDPCGLVDEPAGELPPELDHVLADRPTLAMVGVIDGRKHLPLVLQAWRLASETAECDLVIAGKQTSSISSWLNSAGPLPGNIHFVDRYLTDVEVRGVLERSKAIFALYDGGLSSGFLIASAAFGRWAITIGGSRTASVAVTHGFGVVCASTTAGVADAIDIVLSKTEMPTPVDVPSSTEFGRHVLRQMIDAEEG